MVPVLVPLLDQSQCLVPFILRVPAPVRVLVPLLVSVPYRAPVQVPNPNSGSARPIQYMFPFQVLVPVLVPALIPVLIYLLVLDPLGVFRLLCTISPTQYT